jgi:hypothetical protein
MVGGKPRATQTGRGFGRGSAITSAYLVSQTTTQEIGKLVEEIHKFKEQKVHITSLNLTVRTSFNFNTTTKEERLKQRRVKLLPLREI